MAAPSFKTMWFCFSAKDNKSCSKRASSDCFKMSQDNVYFVFCTTQSIDIATSSSERIEMASFSDRVEPLRVRVFLNTLETIH